MLLISFATSASVEHAGFIYLDCMYSVLVSALEFVCSIYVVTYVLGHPKCLGYSSAEVLA